MDSTSREVISFIEENDVTFFRLACCDVFEEGISLDASAIAGLKGSGNSDLFWFPDCQHAGYSAMVDIGWTGDSLFLRNMKSGWNLIGR